jgi:hypothetical protein
MFSRIIHQLFDGTLTQSSKDQLLGTVRNNPDAMNEYRQQERLHDAVQLDKHSILASYTPDDDLAVIFGRVSPSNSSATTIPMIPVAIAHAPERFTSEIFPKRKQQQRPLQAGFAPSKSAEKKHRSPLLLLSHMPAFALTFCVIGAIAATFGVTPLHESIPFIKNTLESNVTQNAVKEVASTSQAHERAAQNLPPKLRGGIATNNTGGLGNASNSFYGLSDSDRTRSKNQPTFAFVQASNRAASEALFPCELKARKQYFSELNEIPAEAVPLLATTKLPRNKAQRANEQFKPYTMLTARTSSNLFTSGFGASIGAIYALTARDAFGVEIGGTFGRVAASEGRQILSPTGLIATMYRFTLPVEGTKLSVFSHVRLGIETTGTLFGGMGIGAQYEVSDKVILFATAEGARTLWKAPETAQPLRMAHDGLSLGVALKL